MGNRYVGRMTDHMTGLAPLAFRPTHLPSEIPPADVVVVGAGVGGVAAAVGALRNGATVVLTDAGDRIGGQFTAQLVPPDEHTWIEPNAGAYGQTAAYAKLRYAVRTLYRAHYPVDAQFLAQSQPNPGNAWVSRIAADPAVWETCLWQLLMPWCMGGQLTVLLEHAPVGASMTGERIDAVAFRGPGGCRRTAAGWLFIDSTELGDLLPLTGSNHTIGREANTDELHNEATVPDPADQQAFTAVLAVGYNRQGGDHTIPRPAGYGIHRPQFDAWFAQPGKVFDPTHDHPWSASPNLWQYRRVAAHSEMVSGALVEEVGLLNIHPNDYKGGVILGVDEATRAASLVASRELSLSLLYYLQTDIPRPDDGHGYPALRLRPDVSRTPDGVAAHPYIREGRRMVTLGRIWEWHVGVDNRVARLGKPAEELTAAQFTDSVGTGHYWLDVHGGPVEPDGWNLRCYTYQIPLMALIPVNVDNLLAGGKCLGTSHITNGAYRLHPTEWSVGEAAGVIAAYCAENGIDPAAARATRLSTVQSLLRGQGFQLEWPTSLRSRWN